MCTANTLCGTGKGMKEYEKDWGGESEGIRDNMNNLGKFRHVHTCHCTVGAWNIIDLFHQS